VTRALAITLAAVVALVGGGASPAAADEIARGAIIKIERDEIYVNLGRGRGLVDGAPLRIKRRINLKHPVTRAPVSDWIPIGAATVTEAGERMSRAIIGGLITEVAVGDIAEIYVDTPDAPRPAPTPEPVEPRVAAPAPEPIARDTQAVLAVFSQQSGATLDARIAAWEGYQSTYPTSPHAAAIASDLEQLRELRRELQPSTRTSEDVAPVVLQHAAPTIVRAGADIPLVFLIDRPERVASGWLHYRTAGARTYQRVLLRREHELYLRGAIPAAAVAGGAVEYFVEVTSPRGDGGVAIGAPGRPLSIQIEKPRLVEAFGGERGRTMLTLSVTYLDFANLDTRAGDRTDREVFGEVDVRYELRGRLRAIGTGYGAFTGTGGADAVWNPANPAPRTGYNYGYVEAEVAVAEATLPISVAGRLYLGVGRDGFEPGGEGRIRLGAVGGSNLTASARNLGTIGFLSDLRLEVWPRERIPVGVAVAVMDQPAADDLGVRLGIDLGYTIGPVAPVLKVSWQGRSIDHGGVGGGLALAFRW
jgi:hypothetical protein